MRYVFIDTNILMDALDASRPMHSEAVKILTLAKQGVIKGMISAQSVVDVSFLYTKRHKERAEELKSLIKKYDHDLTILDTKRHDIILAASNYYDDYEDAVQTAMAIDNYCDLIISRVTNFDGSFGPPVVSPDEFCREYFEE